MDPIEEVKSEIAEVKEQIKAVSEEINEAKEGIKRAEEAGNLSEKQRWVKREEQLRENKNELLKQKNKLLDEKARLQSAGVDKDDLADQVRQMQSEIADLRLGRVQSDSEIANLHLKLDSSTRTSRTEADVGREARARSKRVTNLPFIACETPEMMENAVQAVKECFPGAKATGRTFPIAKSLQTINEEIKSEPEPEVQRAGGAKTSDSDSCSNPPHLTLVDLIPQAQLSEDKPKKTQLSEDKPKKSQFSEDKHMQPCVMKIIHAVKKAVGSKLIVMDTHSSSNQFINPVGRPDASMLAEELIAWTQLVTVGEFKVNDGKDDVDSMFGQQIGRGQVALENQPDRQHFFSFGLNMNALEVVHIHRDSDCKWVIETTGLQPFYIGEDSVGFRWLVRLLATEKSKLGFVSPVLPNLSVLEGVRVGRLQLLRRGTGPSTVGSWVFTAERDGYAGKCILKLCDRKLEGDLLGMLTAEDVPHLVKVLASGECTYQGRQWHVLLLAPYAQRLTMQLGRKSLVQAARDVADAINGCLEKGVLHRDISLDNIGVFEGRGLLFDFSAAKVVAPEDVDKIQPASPTGKLGAITGTPLYAPLSVLQGRSHTRSSMLEGLYISLLACCCDEKVARRHDMKLSDLEKCAELRAGRMLAAEPSDLKRVPDEFRGFLSELHDLFYPRTPGRSMRDYCMQVTAEQFNGVCSKWAH